MNSANRESLHLHRENKGRDFKVGEFLQRNMPWMILIVACGVFSMFSGNFFRINNIINILNQNAYVVVAAIGISFIMMSGALDLSVGYQMSLIGILSAMLMRDYHAPVAVTLLFAIGLGIGLSLLNMVLSLKLRLPLMMVTVGTMTIYQGFSYEISQSETIGGFSKAFKFLGQGYVGRIPFSIILTAVLFLLFSFFLNKTYWGRYVYALGGNEEAAHLAGIHVTKVKIMIACIAGGMVGLSSMMLVSRLGSTQSAIGPGTEFTVITGILLGGVSIRGGEGKLSGVLAGILIMAILSNGMQLAGMGIYIQYIAKGAIMLAAIGFDVYQLNRRQKAKKRREKTQTAAEAQ